MIGREHVPDTPLLKNSQKFAIACGSAAMSRAAPVVFRGGFAESMSSAKRAGYHAVEFHLRHPDQVDRERIRQQGEELGVNVSAVATGLGFVLDKLSLIDDDADVRLKAIQRLKEHIDLCSELNCDIVIGSMRGNIPDFDRYDVYVDRLTDGLKRVAEYAAPRRTRLLLEAINRYEINYLNSIEKTLGLMDKVGSPELYIHIDTFHMNIEDADMAAGIRLCGQRLGYVHFSDSNRKHPGAGHLDFAAIVEALRKTGYDGYYAVECLPGPDPDETAKKAIGYLKQVLLSAKF